MSRVGKVIKPEAIGKEFDSLEADLREEDVELHREMHTLNAQVEALSAKAAALQKSIDPEVREELKSMTAKVIDVERYLHSHTEGLKAIAQKLAAFDARIKALESKP